MTFQEFKKIYQLDDLSRRKVKIIKKVVDNSLADANPIFREEEALAKYAVSTVRNSLNW